MGGAPKPYNRSLLVACVTGVVKFVYVRLTPVPYLRRLYDWRHKASSESRQEFHPARLAEVYIIAFLALLIVLFAALPRSCAWLTVTFAGFRLYDVLFATMRDVFVLPDGFKNDEGEYIPHRGFRRWIICALINLATTVVAFASAYYRFGNEFNPSIAGRMTALYYSVVTMTTLGYGDIKPATEWGQGLVVVQLAFFVLYVLLMLPMVLSAVRAKDLRF